MGSLSNARQMGAFALIADLDLPNIGGGKVCPPSVTLCSRIWHMMVFKGFLEGGGNIWQKNPKFAARDMC